jgi:hypothetical protein
MLASDVRPMTCKIDDPLLIGKKRKAKQMFPTRPSISAELSNLASHLPNHHLSIH